MLISGTATEVDIVPSLVSRQITKALVFPCKVLGSSTLATDSAQARGSVGDARPMSQLNDTRSNPAWGGGGGGYR